MKKALIDIKRINNSDVITTSACSASLNNNDILFQSNGNKSDIIENALYDMYYLYPKDNNCYFYNNGEWDSYSYDAYGYCFTSAPVLAEGKWYHIINSGPNYFSTGVHATLVECTDPNHHGASTK